MAVMSWKIATGLICIFGIFKDFRPSESFLTSYLTDPGAKNLSLTEVNNSIYPIWTYSYLGMLVIVLLITDFLRYKPIVILEAFSYIITWCLLLWGQGVLSMQFMQFAYGGATATEIAYYSYVYAAVTDTYFRRVSGFIRASSLGGRFLAASLGQILITFAEVEYFTLNIISMTNVCIAFVVSLALPKVRYSFYFHQKAECRTSLSAGDMTLEETLKVPQEQKARTTRAVYSAPWQVSDMTMEETLKASEEQKAGTTRAVYSAPWLVSDMTMEETSKVPEEQKARTTRAVYSAPWQVSDMTMEETLKASEEQKAEMISAEYSAPQVVGDITLAKTLKASEEQKTGTTGEGHPDPSRRERVSFGDGLAFMWEDFKTAYSHKDILLWSFWWSAASTGNLQMGNYIQNLWKAVSPNRARAKNYNGAVDAVSMLFMSLPLRK